MLSLHERSANGTIRFGIPAEKGPADLKAYFADLGDHAGEMETSVMLHVAPELVRPLSEAGPGRARRY